MFTLEKVCKVSRSFTISNLRKTAFSIDFNGYLGHLDGEITSECCLKFHKCLMTLFSSNDLYTLKTTLNLSTTTLHPYPLHSTQHIYFMTFF